MCRASAEFIDLRALLVGLQGDLRELFISKELGKSIALGALDLAVKAVSALTFCRYS